MKRLFFLALVFILASTAWAGDLPPFEGLIEPREVVNFGSQVPGILEKVMVERGDRVEVGQVLARLKSGVEAAALRTAEAKVDFGQRKSHRNEELTRKKLISVHEKDEIETELQLARLMVSEAKEQLELRVIRSTVKGVVVKRTGSPGGYVGEEAFLTVAQIDPLNVELVIPVQYIGAIKEGMKAKVLPDEPVGGEYEARVVVVDKVVDAASGTFGVRLELPNPQLKLPAGMKCRVVF
jgi:membrane fusion protein, multidrug efflux system